MHNGIPVGITRPKFQYLLKLVTGSRYDGGETMARSPSKARAATQEQLLEWVERVAMLFHNDAGVPPIMGRILGWLMVCDPPEQSGAQIAEAIGASRASITTNMQVLTGAGLVRRLTRPGARTAYYVIDDDAWERLVMRRQAILDSFASLAAEGVELLGGSGPLTARARSAHEVFKWFGGVLRDAAPSLDSKRRRR
jgi:DNA-binding MarR family transcriptional regulator